jgi:hypothetical protein
MLAQHIAWVADQHGPQNQGRGGTARSTKAVVESQDDLEDRGRVAQCWSRRVRALAKCSNVYSDPIEAVSGRSQLGKRLDRRIVVKL